MSQKISSEPIFTSKINNEKSNKVSFAICSTCKKPANLRCTKCKLEWYCTRKCQANHWEKHKLLCSSNSGLYKEFNSPSYTATPTVNYPSTSYSVPTSNNSWKPTVNYPSTNYSVPKSNDSWKPTVNYPSANDTAVSSNDTDDSDSSESDDSESSSEDEDEEEESEEELRIAVNENITATILKDNYIYKSNNYPCYLNGQTFRDICIAHLGLIRKVPVIPLSTNSENEAVLIEFRELPHIEFIIRNAIHKLGNLFSYTVICGNSNYYMVWFICKNISDKIKIIKLDVDNMINSQYNDLMLSEGFWNLLTGKKVLLYQEDTMIFKKNIRDFLKYDYIGAPWKLTKPTNYVPSVGNGGFSLRNRLLMIKILSKKDELIQLFKTKSNSLEDYDYIEEDIFYSKALLFSNNKNLPDTTTASDFSTENVVNHNSLGGHKFWNLDGNWQERMRLLTTQLSDEIGVKL